MDAVRECLELRAGRGVTLPVAHAKVLEEIPANAGSLSIGDTPSFMKKLLPFLGSLPTSMVSSLSGTTDVELRFRVTFSSQANAKLFLSVADLMKQGFLKVAAGLSNPDVSAAVVKAMESFRLEPDANRVVGRMQIPAVAWTAFTEAVQDIPPEELAGKNFIPGKKR